LPVCQGPPAAEFKRANERREFVEVCRLGLECLLLILQGCERQAGVLHQAVDDKVEVDVVEAAER
jgi:hypothetical protein